MQEPGSHSIRTEISALIVAAISLAMITVWIGIGSNVTAGHLEAAMR